MFNWLKRFFSYRVLTKAETNALLHGYMHLYENRWRADEPVTYVPRTDKLKAAFGDDKVLIVVDSLMWADTPLNLAGYHFKNCDFVCCELMFNGMPFQMTNCRFNGVRMIDVIYQPKGNNRG